MTSTIWAFSVFVIAVIFIVLMTAKYKLHAFLVLLLAAYFVALFSGMPIKGSVSLIANGFGHTIGYIGIVIACGTIVGTILEKSGGAFSMADAVLKVVGKSKSPLAMGITGFIVSIAVFCDSGFVILSPLNKALSKQSKISLAIYAMALSTGLYATHTLVPPTPGPIAAAGLLSADLGTVIVLGLIVSIPAAIVGYFFATKYASRFKIESDITETYDELKKKYKKLPSATSAFLPIVVPIVLIIFKSIADFPSHVFGTGTAKIALDFIGNPNTALLIAVFVALFGLAPNFKKEVIGTKGWVGIGLTNAAIIILITGAGGSFGAVLKASPLIPIIKQMPLSHSMGILLPFIIAAVLKTAQGSSTVAIITTSAIIAPILGPLGLASPIGRALAVMSVGAGSMVVSHANDSYFWVVSQFSNMDVPTAYKTQTLATLFEGVTALIVVLIMAPILLH